MVECLFRDRRQLYRCAHTTAVTVASNAEPKRALSNCDSGQGRPRSSAPLRLPHLLLLVRYLTRHAPPRQFLSFLSSEKANRRSYT